MLFAVHENNGDYVVEAYIIEDHYSLRGYWRPLRNFGSRQGDAIEFKEYDCPSLPEPQLSYLVKHYDPDCRYIRVNGSRFVKQCREAPYNAPTPEVAKAIDDWLKGKIQDYVKPIIDKK